MYQNQEQFVIKSEAWSRWDSFAKPQTLISLDRDGGSGEGGRTLPPPDFGRIEGANRKRRHAALLLANATQIFRPCAIPD